MPARLISDAWRRPLAWASAVAGLLFAALALVVFRSASTSLDTWMFRELYLHVGDGSANVLLEFATPAMSLVLLAVVAGTAALLRRWDLAALAVLGPGVTVFLAEVVLKPLIGRYSVLFYFGITERGSFPSGHEAVVASTACVLLIATSQLPIRRRARGVIVAVLATWTLVAAIALVRAFYHYATDTVGAICLAIGVVSCAALLIDRYAGAVLRRPRRESLSSLS